MNNNNTNNTYNPYIARKTVDFPTRDGSDALVSQRNRETEPVEIKKEENVASQTKIININDFVMRQTLEFYPNLAGISCIDNNIILKQNGEIIAREPVLFDLRTLPGEAWNVSPKEFIEIIKINKSCNKLNDFYNFLNSNPELNDEHTEALITKYMNLYFTIKDSFHYLTENNKIITGNIENAIALLPKESSLGKTINQKLDEYFETTKKIGDTKGKGMVLELKNKNLPSVEEDNYPLRKTGFINIAILIYGILNIGLILAIAIMK